MIQCDPEQLKQVLLNLMLNAIQSSPTGGVVQLRARREASRLILEVTDEGRGIPPELRERIFEPFFTTRENGTGLGLAVAAKIAEQHEGSLAALANDAGGATLRLDLPLREVTGS
jgi:signal transduction histidine kinase